MNRSRQNGCGINGDFCRPFDNSTFTFRCPASCLKAQILEPYAVGDTMINYRPLVIGGPMNNDGDTHAQSVYRGDSFICASAIHSGYLKDEKGGCGVVKLVGERSEYPSTKHHGIKSIGYHSYFPQSFGFVKGTAATCEDLRWPLLAVSVIYSVIISLFTTSPLVFFWTIFTGLFIHVALVSDPPGYSDYRSLVSTAAGRFVPAAFCMVVMYLAAIRFTLRDLKAQVEKTVLWLGACWVGSLNNYTFDKIPISRLTPHDIQQQPGAVPALIIIITALLSIVLSQAWFIRIEGLMPKYLAIYGILCGSVLVLLAVPGLKLRIHHYILGLLLLPGTRLQMRPSLLYQGLLVGFFINGIARWGFDSILQTAFELRGDAPLGTRLPTVLPPAIHTNLGTGRPANISFEWIFLGDNFDGVSVLVNDVERFKGYRDQGVSGFTWRRTRVGLPEYFRFAYLSGGEAGDYTRAGVWDEDLHWTEMEPGPSR
jgi:LCCL domain